jgi:DNA-binding winged helix-turn-helix (wHTH) protein
VSTSSARIICWTWCGADGSSPSRLTSHINAVRKAIGDNGEEQRLVRTIARKGFRFVGEVREADASDGINSPRAEPATPDEAAAPARTLPDKPSIAVLAFQNLSGDPEQEYFADGVVEDIITALSRIRAAVRHRAQFELHLQGRAVA